MPLIIFIEALISIALGASAQLLLKIGSSRVGALAGAASFGEATRIALCNLPLIAGLTLYGASAIIWIHVLSAVNLSTAYPLVGLSFVFVVLLGVVILGERVTLLQLLGCVTIIAGIMLVLKGQAT